MHIVTLDVADEASVHAAASGTSEFSKILHEYGLDYIVNNAAVVRMHPRSRQRVPSITERQFISSRPKATTQRLRSLLAALLTSLLPTSLALRLLPNLSSLTCKRAGGRLWLMCQAGSRASRWTMGKRPRAIASARLRSTCWYGVPYV